MIITMLPLLLSPTGSGAASAWRKLIANHHALDSYDIEDASFGSWLAVVSVVDGSRGLSRAICEAKSRRHDM